MDQAKSSIIRYNDCGGAALTSKYILTHVSAYQANQIHFDPCWDVRAAPPQSLYRILSYFCGPPTRYITRQHMSRSTVPILRCNRTSLNNREKQALTSCFPSPDWSSVVVLHKHSVTIGCHCLLLRCLCLNSVTIEARLGIYSRGNRYTDGKQRLSISETPLQYKQI